MHFMFILWPLNQLNWNHGLKFDGGIQIGPEVSAIRAGLSAFYQGIPKKII